MDQKLFYLINQQWASPWLDLPMVLLSSFDFWLPFFALAIIWFLVRGGFYGRMFVITLALTIALTDGVVINTLKKAAQRTRPRDAQAVRVLDFAKSKPRFLAIAQPLVIKTSKPSSKKQGGRSFPSGHAGNCFAVATVIFLFFRRWGWVSYFFATGVALSRLYVGAHWPSDVFASMFIGSGVAVFTVWLVNYSWRHFGDEFFPKLHARHPFLFPPKKASVETNKGESIAS